MDETGRGRVILLIAVFCVLPLFGLGFYLIAPTIVGEISTTQVTITSEIVGTGTSQYTASIIYTTSGFTSLCNYFGPPFGCGSLRTAYAATSYSTTTATFTSTQMLVTTFLSEATLAPHAMSQQGGIGTIAAAIILGIALVVARRGARPVTSPIDQKETYEQPVATIKASTYLCYHCGARIPVDSTFCEECGERLQTTGLSSFLHARERTSQVSRKGHVPWDGSSASAEFEGWCPRCHRQIHLGDKITWWKDDNDNIKWIHLKCR